MKQTIEQIKCDVCGRVFIYPPEKEFNLDIVCVTFRERGVNMKTVDVCPTCSDRIYKVIRRPTLREFFKKVL